MQKVIAFAPKEDERNISSFRRESSFWKETVLFDLDGESPKEVVCARWYGAGETSYCVVWVRASNYGQKSARGYGKAGGYGYEKSSASFAEALEKAGFEFAEGIAGVGETAIRRALAAIAEHFQIAKPFVHVAHA